ncbi:hypothetical protein CTAYLR_010364 [Chrysophaeum taylorii]|uniref:Wntless-like transmembrane domain-containing protein n=1 Tax=Chrysophaeum taylorii TaxID=2483200 RepID=A0AAD7UA01_9STRA|nr:hypothetical protein CTAYLR_010364 [Chrysophaeum taylorii]
MRTDKRSVVVAACSVVVMTALTLTVGAVGPHPFITHRSSQRTRSAMASRITVYAGELVSMVPEHQMLWLQVRVKRPASFGTNERRSFQLVFEVSAWGGAREVSLANERYYAADIVCAAGESWCEAVGLFAQHAVLYSKYRVEAHVVDAATTGYPEGDALTTEADLRFANREFTSFVLWWSACCELVSIAALARLGTRLYGLARWTPEQRWTVTLAVALVAGFDYPLFSAEVYAGSKAASLAISIAYIYAAFAFVGLLLAHFLCLARAKVPGSSSDSVFFVAVLCAAIAIFGATTNIFYRLQDSREPGYSSPGRDHVFHATRACLIVLVAIYVSWFAVDLARASSALRKLPPHETLLFALALAVATTVLAAIFEGGFDTVAKSSLQFAAFFAIPNYYVWTLVFLFSPLKVAPTVDILDSAPSPRRAAAAAAAEAPSSTSTTPSSKPPTTPPERNAEMC